MVDATSVIDIATKLGTRFFIGFLIGAGVGFYFTHTVYLSLGIGLALGFLLYLLIP